MNYKLNYMIIKLFNFSAVIFYMDKTEESFTDLNKFVYSTSYGN